ncbi:MAG: laccase domain-containing protein, partial [Deltaproteobacteria bacterium]
MKAAITSEVLERTGVRHGFSTRAAGSLDELGLSCARLGIEERRLVLLQQVHGADVVVAGEKDLERFRAERPVADAAVTAEDRITVGVRTADCLPVLLAAGDGAVVAAAHAGWRGVLAGVVPATVERMASLGAEPRRLVAALGPSIRP